MSRMPRFILTDVDDTVLDFANTFSRWATQNGFATNGVLRDSYSIESFLGLSREECESALAEFAKSEDIAAQPPEPCARNVLPDLYGSGYDFVAITACGLDPDFRMKRWRTLGVSFGFPWMNVHVVRLGGSKREVLESFPPSIWVEDHFGHAVDGSESGHRSFVITRPYNEGLHHPKVTRVKDWHEIKEILDHEL